MTLYWIIGIGLVCIRGTKCCVFSVNFSIFLKEVKVTFSRDPIAFVGQTDIQPCNYSGSGKPTIAYGQSGSRAFTRADWPAEPKLICVIISDHTDTNSICNYMGRLARLHRLKNFSEGII